MTYQHTKIFSSNNLEGFILLHYYFILRLKLHTKEKNKDQDKGKKEEKYFFKKTK
jgi:hypothetical protein